MELHAPGGPAHPEDLRVAVGVGQSLGLVGRPAGVLAPAEDERPGVHPGDEGVAGAELDRLPAEIELVPRGDVAAGRLAELLGAEADAERRQCARQSRREQLALASERRRGRLVADATAAAERDERVAARELGDARQGVAPVEAPHVETQSRVTQVLADEGGRRLGLVLHDDDGRHGSCTILLATSVAPAERARGPRRPGRAAHPRSDMSIARNRPGGRR
jgi:hypothetical protein